MTEFQKVANDLLTEFGFDCVVSNYTKSGFDVENGVDTVILKSISSAKAVFTDLLAGELKDYGYVSQSGDKKILLSLNDLVVKIDVKSIITISNVEYNINFISEVKDKLETALFKLVIREKSGA